MTFCTNVLLFCMCYAVYCGTGRTCWCSGKTPRDRERLMYDVSWFNELGWTMKSWSLMLWTVKSPPASYLMIRWSLVFVLTVWLHDIASPIPSWHRLRRGGVKFARLDLHIWLYLLTYRVALLLFSLGSWSIFRYYVRTKFPDGRDLGQGQW